MCLHFDTFWGNPHQLSVLLAQTSQLLVRGAQCVQRLHENCDLFACVRTYWTE